MADVEVQEQPQVPPPSNTYVIRPNFQHKFRPVIVKECIHNVLNERLDGKSYDPEEIMDWTKTIADDIKTKLKGWEPDDSLFCVAAAFGVFYY
ncbi:DYT2B-like protein [Mya arenaria]|uniref:DYT2B-like protein n=1 Tax=Mya arenaria TaxID=6604 RepID=A0ABY7FZ36_MYAAR|nr:DYT2B-like protein [Mya arenaria]